MNAPWFSDPNMFGAWYGTIVGGVGGSLMGLLGALAGYYAPRGKGRAWILGAFGAFAVFGVLQLVVGLVALFTGQPYAIWYPFTLCGGGGAIIMGSLYPVVRKGYDLAEQRRIDAHAIRNA